MTFTKCCWRCGRWGTLQFIESGRSDAVGAWECANDRACARRTVAARRVTNWVEHHT